MDLRGWKNGGFNAWPPHAPRSQYPERESIATSAAMPRLLAVTDGAFALTLSANMEFLIKVIISALIVAGVSMIGRRSSAFAAILASLPVTSILALIWLYLDTKDAGKVRELSVGIIWAVIPSLIFFLALYTLLKYEMQFWWALAASCGVMIVSYSFYLLILKRFGIVI